MNKLQKELSIWLHVAVLVDLLLLPADCINHEGSDVECFMYFEKNVLPAAAVFIYIKLSKYGILPM